MSTGLSAYAAGKALAAMGRNESFAVTQAYVQLHVGDPGAAGTSNTATETTRKAAAFAAPSGGAMANSSAITWSGIAGSQDATHFTAWDAASGGNFLFSGVVVGPAYTAGNTVSFAAGALVATLAIAA